MNKALLSVIAFLISPSVHAQYRLAANDASETEILASMQHQATLTRATEFSEGIVSHLTNLQFGGSHIIGRYKDQLVTLNFDKETQALDWRSRQSLSAHTQVTLDATGHTMLAIEDEILTLYVWNNTNVRWQPVHTQSLGYAVSKIEFIDEQWFYVFNRTHSRVDIYAYDAQNASVQFQAATAPNAQLSDRSHHLAFDRQRGLLFALMRNTFEGEPNIAVYRYQPDSDVMQVAFSLKTKVNSDGIYYFPEHALLMAKSYSNFQSYWFAAPDAPYVSLGIESTHQSFGSSQVRFDTQGAFTASFERATRLQPRIKPAEGTDADAPSLMWENTHTYRMDRSLSLTSESTLHQGNVWLSAFKGGVQAYVMQQDTILRVDELYDGDHNAISLHKTQIYPIRDHQHALALDRHNVSLLDLQADQGLKPIDRRALVDVLGTQQTLANMHVFSPVNDTLYFVQPNPFSRDQAHIVALSRDEQGAIQRQSIQLVLPEALHLEAEHAFVSAQMTRSWLVLQTALGNYWLFSPQTDGTLRFVNYIPQTSLSTKSITQLVQYQDQLLFWSAKQQTLDIYRPNASTLHTVNVDRRYVSPGANLLALGRNIYFIHSNSDTISAFQLTNDTLNFLSYSRLAYSGSLHPDSLVPLSNDQLLHLKNYSQATFFGIDQQTGIWKQTGQLDDIRAYRLSHRSQDIMPLASGSHFAGSMLSIYHSTDAPSVAARIDINTGPTLKYHLPEIQTNHQQSIALNDFIYHPDKNDRLTYSIEALPESWQITPQGQLSIEQSVEVTRPPLILVSDTQGQTLRIPLNIKQ